MARTHAALIEAANETLIVDGNLDAIGDYFGFFRELRGYRPV